MKGSEAGHQEDVHIHRLKESMQTGRYASIQIHIRQAGEHARKQTEDRQTSKDRRQADRQTDKQRQKSGRQQTQKTARSRQTDREMDRLVGS